MPMGYDIGLVIASEAKQSIARQAAKLDCFVASLLAMTMESYPPLTGGITTWSRRQARRSSSSQARNCRSLLRQMRTSLSRFLLQVTAIADVLRPGLALMKAASISSGATVFGSANCRYSSGILTAERALRMVSK